MVELSPYTRQVPGSSPGTCTMKNNTHKSLDGVYQFMADAYHGNWQYRWDKTPYLQKNIKAGKNESISGHQWACIGFWFYLSRICPSLSRLVDTAEIYERLWSHDLGETFEGDVSQVLQLAGKGMDKHKVERKEIQEMGKNIPKKILAQLIKWFDEFENEFTNIKKLEILIVKFIDTIEGNHFAFVFGSNLSKHKATVRKIVDRSFVPVARQLLKVLEKHGHKKAYQEVKAVALHHLKMVNKAGARVNPDSVF